MPEAINQVWSVDFMHDKLEDGRNRPELGQRVGLRFEYIQPGKPQQNAYVERFNRTVRYEWSSQYYCSSIEEVQDFFTQWMWSYNHDRPNMALCGFTPKQQLAMAAQTFYFSHQWKLGGLPNVAHLSLRFTIYQYRIGPDLSRRYRTLLRRTIRLRDAHPIYAEQ